MSIFESDEDGRDFGGMVADEYFGPLGEHFTIAQLKKAQELLGTAVPTNVVLPHRNRDVLQFDHNGVNYKIFSDGSLKTGALGS